MTFDFHTSAMRMATMKASRAAHEKSMGRTSWSTGSRSDAVELSACAPIPGVVEAITGSRGARQAETQGREGPAPPGTAEVRPSGRGHARLHHVRHQRGDDARVAEHVQVGRQDLRVAVEV